MAFKVGDKVLITGPSAAGYKGRIGQVATVETVAATYVGLGSSENGTLFFFNSVQAVPAFKKGDRVEILGPSAAGFTAGIGKVAIIASGPTDDGFWCVDWSPKYLPEHGSYFRPEDLRLAPSAVTAERLGKEYLRFRLERAEFSLNEAQKAVEEVRSLLA